MSEINLADAYELAADWHDKHARGCREIAGDYRVGKDIQAKSRMAAVHHAASAAGLRNAAIQIRRAKFSALQEGKEGE